MSLQVSAQEEKQLRTRSARLSVVSLFTGAGGLDLGLEAAGNVIGVDLRTSVAVESDPIAAETLRSAVSSGYFRSNFRVLSDVTTTSGEDLIAAADDPLLDVFIVAGGPPCPSFSTAGNRQSLSDFRGQLVFDFLRIVEELNPRFFLMENVRGLLSAAIKHRPLNQRGPDSPQIAPEEELGSALKSILSEMGNIGYQVAYGKVNAANYGSPQLRHRTLFIGSRDHELPSENILDLMPKTHGPDSPTGLPWNTLSSALHPPLTEADQEYQNYSPERKNWFEMIPAGRNWRFLRDESPKLAEQAMGGAWLSGGGKVGFYRRLAWDRPSPTLLTSPTQKATGFCHPDFIRPLSVQEYSRIQEFPDGYPLAGSVAQKYRQLGNAVPTSLGRAAGEAILNIVDAT